MKKIINAKNFKHYGWVIEYPKKAHCDPSKNLFRIVKRECRACGWRIAYLIVRDKEIGRLEQHVDTFESFEPIKGKSLLYVADRKDPLSIESFYLDRPVILKKGIWHGVVALRRESEIKITENALVRSVYWKLKFALNSKPHLQNPSR
jgi:hypothetical protein